MPTRVSRFAIAVVGAAAALVFAAGAALAASGGGFGSPQQDCPGNASAWNAPYGYVPSGCHSVAANVESGGTTNGDANSNNTRFAEAGVDQSPLEPHNPAFGAEENVGDPGTPDSPHSGCLAANTDGTGGGTGTGCGNNPKGAGFSARYDYYQFYCPVAALLPVSSTPDPTGGSLPAAYKCQAGQTIAMTNITLDKGTATALDTLVTKGVIVYLGAYDNLDNGEHDGFSGLNHTNGAINGPSDGGASTLSVTPQSATRTPTASHPEGLANYSLGFCADGICTAGSTQQQSVYQGCDAKVPNNNAGADRCAKGTPKDGNVYENNTPASTQASSNCSSGGLASEKACYTNQNGSPNPGGANAYRQHTPQNMNVEPGVQTYQDPDPQRSPAAPFGTPGVYAGTCGVYVNDGGGAGSPGVSGLVTGGAVNVNPGYVGGVDNCPAR